MRRMVRDDPLDPDPAFAELYASFSDATDLEPWLRWCREADGPVLYVGVGTGRLAVPLAAAGVRLVGVDAHPGMLERLRTRLPDIELVLARIEEAYKSGNGAYTYRLADLAAASGDPARFEESMRKIFDPNKFRIQANKSRYILKARALDRGRTEVTLAGP